MPVSITVKNIPDSIYEQLKVAAHAHHRSLNSEMIACLETILLPVKINPMERLLRAKTLRSHLECKEITAVEINNFKIHGRA